MTQPTPHITLCHGFSQTLSPCVIHLKVTNYGMAKKIFSHIWLLKPFQLSVGFFDWVTSLFCLHPSPLCHFCHFLVNLSPTFICNVISHIYLMIVRLHTLFRTKFIVCSFVETFSGLCQTSQLHLRCFAGFWISFSSDFLYALLFFSLPSFWNYLIKI